MQIHKFPPLLKGNLAANSNHLRVKTKTLPKIQIPKIQPLLIKLLQEAKKKLSFNTLNTAIWLLQYVWKIKLKACSIITCIARTDYNICFALFGYFLLLQRSDYQILWIVTFFFNLQLILKNAVSILIDIFWIFSIGMIWIDFPEEPHKIWSKMAFAHYTAFIFSIVSVILKVK